MKPTDLRQPVKLPFKVNFSKLAIWSFLLMFGVTTLALVTRVRTIVALAELVDLLVILFLLVAGAATLILGSIETSSSSNSDPKSNP